MEYVITLGLSKLSFTSSNSSFSECVTTKSHSSYLYLSSLSSNNEYDGSIYEECSFIQSNRPALSTTSTKFMSCTFSTIRSTVDGGAISLTDSTQQLYITYCSFQSCVSSSGYGGAIYAYGISSFSVEKTFFFDCNSTYKDRGGIYLESSYCIPLV